MRDGIAGRSVATGLLSVEEVAGYLGVGPVTVYRWCRDGRLPCVKLGKFWRIRGEALEDYLRQRERSTTLVGQLSSFLQVPDNVIGIAQTTELLHGLDAAFFLVAEACGGLLVKFHGGEPDSSIESLRAGLAAHGLEVGRLESEGRLRFIAERYPVSERVGTLRRLLAEESESGRTIWASFDWTVHVDLETAVRQQEELGALVDARHLVVKTAVLERVADEWPSAMLRSAQASHSGMIWLSECGLALSRVVPVS